MELRGNPTASTLMPLATGASGPGRKWGRAVDGRRRRRPAGAAPSGAGRSSCGQTGQTGHVAVGVPGRADPRPGVDSSVGMWKDKGPAQRLKPALAGGPWTENAGQPA